MGLLCHSWIHVQVFHFQLSQQLQHNLAATFKILLVAATFSKMETAFHINPR